MDLRPKTMELLAPAGSFEAFKAAVENGADAVYLGGQSFNARASAANFDLDSLREAVRYAHEREVKVYVTVNILIADREFPEFIDYLFSLYELGVDAVILQDPGVAAFMQKVLPEQEKHASTQMTVNTSWGVKHLEGLGFKRVVLARETSAAEMKEIADNTPLEIEVFVHGALCISYSGQCLMSSFIGGRSGNRGTCAQPCRLTYQLVGPKGQDYLAGENIGEHLLSPRDLKLVDYLAKLQTSGVDSLKLEGRMKRPEYVATVVRLYCQALNRLAEFPGATGRLELLADQEKRELLQIFNRDFTQAYFLEHPGAELMSYKRPNNRGTRLGRVLKTESGRLFLKLEAGLQVGDGIEIWTGRGREGLTVDQIWGPQEKMEQAGAGETVQVPFSGQARPGDRVFKTHDSVLMEKARLSFQEGKEQRKRPLRMKLSGKAGEKLMLEASSGELTFAVFSAAPAQAALKRPLNHEYLMQQLGRLGTTPFWLEGLELDLEGEIMLPVSELNDMRRQAVEGLLQEREREHLPVSVYRERVSSWQKEQRKLKIELKSQTETRAKILLKPVVAVAVSDPETLKAGLKGGARRIILGGEQWRSRRGFSLAEIREGMEQCHRAGASAVWRMPRILNQEQSRLWLKRLEEASAWPKRPTVMVSNLGQLELLRLLDPAWPFEVDYSLNVFNEASLYHFFKQGAGMIALSPELHHEQIRPLAHWPKVEVLAFGDLELMVSEYCPVGATRGGKKGESCARPCVQDSHYLRDRLKYDFPLETDQECRMHLFNVKRLNLYQELEQLAGMGVASVRLQLVRENPQEVLEVVKLFTVAWETIAAGRKLGAAEIAQGMATLEGMFPDGFTKGHFFRGVL
ncbi:DUF3656 domain-containing protein [Paradesulfitobacterium aromaticivorans]